MGISAEVPSRTVGTFACAMLLALVTGVGHAQQCDLFKRLITAHDGVFVNDQVTGVPVCGQTSLNGVIRQTVADDLHCATTTAPYGLTVETATCPIPDVAGYLSVHWATAVDVSSAGTSTFNLTAPAGTVDFFRTMTDPDKTGYSAFVGDLDPPTTINVSGTAIWMLNHGFRSNQLVKVNGTANDCLVIVSGKNQDSALPAYLDVGIWCFAGIQSPNVPVILVTDGEIRLEHFNNLTGASAFSVLSYLSAFASHAFLGGPAAPNYLSLYHDPASSYDQPGGLIDALCLHGLLPNVEGPPVRSTPGTWGRLKTLYR